MQFKDLTRKSQFSTWYSYTMKKLTFFTIIGSYVVL